MNLIFATLVTIIWAASAEGPGVGGTPDGYKVYAGSTVTDVGKVTQATIDIDLNTGTQVQVSAYNKGGESPKSAPIVVGKPQAPTGLAVK